MSRLDLSPHASASHWSARYVGRPWAEAFNCWHLVQAVQREQWGRVLPDVPVGEGEADRGALLHAVARGAAWLPVPGDPLAVAKDGDVLLMRGPDGPHVGVALRRAGHPPALLHNLGGMEGGRARGSVRIDAIAALGSLGYGHLRLWRAAP